MVPSRKQPKLSCGKSQTLRSRSGLDNVSVTASLASAEEEEADVGPIATVEEEEADARSIATVEEDEEASPIHIDDYMAELDEFEEKVIPNPMPKMVRKHIMDHLKYKNNNR